jgi:DNA-binding MarR family transcriptional regulator
MVKAIEALEAKKPRTMLARKREKVLSTITQYPGMTATLIASKTLLTKEDVHKALHALRDEGRVFSTHVGRVFSWWAT